MSGWHLTPAQAHDYAARRSDEITAMSVEAHLMHCAPCRSLLPADESWLADSWASLRDVVDRPRRGPVETLLASVGLRAETAKLLAATPRLYQAWLVSTVVVLGAALLAAHLLPRGSLMFFFLAPVVPLVGVALAYGRGVDPAHTLASVTPMAGQRLLFLRTCAVLVPALLLCTGAALMLPHTTTAWDAVFWLLPSLTLVAGSLLLGHWIHLSAASGIVGVLWLAVLGLVSLSGQTVPVGVFAPQAQACWGAALAALVGLLLLRVRMA
ncbi:zf-HC2 domain-containing protein [Nocardiopsis changdeensis]|uniref:Zf-HC2 domain-containing protein n=1 Tax=Nocardiopsis changdeensis TaxID=2831969 RepID=A0ABX8BRN3_9ACTN|nr:MULTISPECIES: zf-HC2 domain-containing protein [Nocardiopsis]QUX24744.1 zf-HC2 domain-containing protein [Nocardiopsis changdeensis]QYX35131.1 zf-HC2 domain-containing protein [Nocardiopsis sp. MT53]